MLRVVIFHKPKWDYVSTVKYYNTCFKKYSTNEIIFIDDHRKMKEISDNHTVKKY